VDRVPASVVLRLRAIQAWDRQRLRRLARRHPGFELHPEASSNFAVARYQLAAGARLRIGAGVVTDRVAGALCFWLGEGASVEVGEGSWLRTEIEPVHLVAFPGARLIVGPDAFLNGCHLSAKAEVRTGRRTWIGLGSRVFDADQHDFDDDTPEQIAAVRIGDGVWIASHVTVLRGVTVGSHSVVGTRSLVIRDVPDHTLVFGQPAQPHGRVGERWNTR
jgi:acetyltransferase-like isoleucine patch superfamily enzyme